MSGWGGSSELPVAEPRWWGSLLLLPVAAEGWGMQRGVYGAGTCADGVAFGNQIGIRLVVFLGVFGIFLPKKKSSHILLTSTDPTPFSRSVMPSMQNAVPTIRLPFITRL